MQINKDITTVFLDFDDTLCRTHGKDGFVHELFGSIAKETGTTRAIVEETAKHALTQSVDSSLSYYDIHKHIALLVKNHDGKEISQETIEEIIRVHVAGYIYKDVLLFLQALELSNKKTVILSFGEHWYQGFKITYSGLGEKVDSSVVIQKSKLEYIRGHISKDEKVLLIDDKLETFAGLENSPNVVPILMDRHNTHNKSETHIPIIHSFFDIEFDIL